MIFVLVICDGGFGCVSLVGEWLFFFYQNAIQMSQRVKYSNSCVYVGLDFNRTAIL